MSTTTLSLSEIRKIAADTLMANGCDAPNAEAIAENMTEAERAGSASHGLFRLAGHVINLRNGRANGKAVPRLEKLSPAALRVHGDEGFAPLALKTGLGPLAEVTREIGVGVLAITRTLHYAALWPETSVLAEQGLAAIAMTSSPPFVAPAGGTKPFFGTNPMAFAWPRKEGEAPMVWDQASSVTARGEIMMHKMHGEPAPQGAGLDADGNPTTDPDAILTGAQLPFGGYKGNSIALMVDLMAGPLIGEVCSFEAGPPNNTLGGPSLGGEIIIAFDPSRLGADKAVAHGERLFDELLKQGGTRIPGGRRGAIRAKMDREGVPVANETLEKIRAL
ncbi:Ldh family oxidoreductase [Rhodobacteraceae bacterium NNCM2]|nr:Ldh family oxidoreductase [Coraliihabitans acroporae]